MSTYVRAHVHARVRSSGRLFMFARVSKNNACVLVCVRSCVRAYAPV